MKIIGGISRNGDLKIFCEKHIEDILTYTYSPSTLIYFVSIRYDYMGFSEEIKNHLMCTQCNCGESLMVVEI